MKKHINLLWTGGWDSTFRLCQLSRQPVVVTPIYIRDPTRLSTNLELAAMKNIRNVLGSKAETVAAILPVKTVKCEELYISAEIKNAFRRVRSLFPNIGGQYEWLAVVAKKYPGIELGEEHYLNKPGTLYSIFYAAGGGLRFDEDNVGHLSTLDKDVNLLLGNFSYPIASYTERQMLEIVHALHYEDVMQHIWFCQHPVDGKPCGVCTPCQIKMKAGMDWLLPDKALKRYRILKFLENQDVNKAERFKRFAVNGLHDELGLLNRLNYQISDIKNHKSCLLEEISYFKNLMLHFS